MSLKGTSLPSILPTTRSEYLYGVYTCGVGWGRFGWVGWGGVECGGGGWYQGEVHSQAMSAR